MGQYVLNENEGKYLFNLCASNGHIVTTSMVFPSKDDCLDGIDRIRRTAKDAVVEDTTSLDWKARSRAKVPYLPDPLGQLLLPVLPG
jgi:uncharacterized protein YegP (UPF0339 family)